MSTRSLNTGCAQMGRCYRYNGGGRNTPQRWLWETGCGADPLMYKVLFFLVCHAGTDDAAARQRYRLEA